MAPNDHGRLEVDRVVALPTMTGPSISGVPASLGGFLPVDAHGKVLGVDGIYAAGDGTSFPVKQGGLAAQQAARPPRRCGPGGRSGDTRAVPPRAPRASPHRPRARCSAGSTRPECRPRPRTSPCGGHPRGSRRSLAPYLAARPGSSAGQLPTRRRGFPASASVSRSVRPRSSHIPTIESMTTERRSRKCQLP